LYVSLLEEPKSFALASSPSMLNTRREFHGILGDSNAACNGEKTRAAICGMKEWEMFVLSVPAD